MLAGSAPKHWVARSGEALRSLEQFSGGQDDRPSIASSRSHLGSFPPAP